VGSGGVGVSGVLMVMPACGTWGTCRSAEGTPSAELIAPTSVFNGTIAPAMEQPKSGEVHRCQITVVRVPKEALFMQGARLAAELRAVDRSLKNLRTKRRSMFVQPLRFGPRARPALDTSIPYPRAFVEPEFTIEARSSCCVRLPAKLHRAPEIDNVRIATASIVRMC